MDLAAARGFGVVLMHMRGTPATMQKDTFYRDMSRRLRNLDERIDACIEAGIDPVSIIADPGIGFGKDVQGNLTLLRRIEEFSSLQVPVLLGHSRKAFMGGVLGRAVADRQDATDVVTAWAAANNVAMVRVHDC
jgi:dihydropteroate synthase